MNDEKRTQKIPGSQNGLRMVINTQLYNYTENAEDGYTESGLRVQVHPSHEPPQVQRLGVGIPGVYFGVRFAGVATLPVLDFKQK